jgi:hypothetical protein
MFMGDDSAEMEWNEFKDRRFFARFNAHVVVRCRHHSVKPANTIDISAQGVGIVSEEELKPETPIEIVLSFPDTNDEFVATGKIIWTRKTEDNKFRIGIALEKPELMMISQFLRNNSNHELQ